MTASKVQGNPYADEVLKVLQSSVEVPLKVSRVKMPCKECEKGFYVYCVDVPDRALQFFHKCTSCGSDTWLPCKFPFLTYTEVAD